MIKIHDIETGEVIEREPNAAELAQQVADRAADAARQEAEAQKAAEEAAKISSKLAIYAKLGLTEEEINTLIS